MATWNDYNDARQNPNLIPNGGYATRGTTGAVYLNCEFTVLEGPYAKRKIFTLIGLYSPKGPDWANMGRGLIRGMLNSARGISDKDISPNAQAARRITSFADLDGIEFVGKIEVGTDTNGEDKNEVRMALTPDHRDYAQIMGRVALPGLPPQAPAPAAMVPPAAYPGAYPAAPPPQAASGDPRPSWAR